MPGRPSSKAIAKAIKIARLSAGMSQEDLAPAVSRRYISDLETGVKSPTLVLLTALARRMGIQSASLVLFASLIGKSTSTHRMAIKKTLAEVERLVEMESNLKRQRAPKRAAVTRAGRGARTE